MRPSLFLRNALIVALAGAPLPATAAVGGGDDRGNDAPIPLEISRLYFEYNSTANDLGVQVALDGENWKRMRISNPKGHSIFEVEGKGGLKKLGLTELFFEGSEPSLNEFPLEQLLALFPKGKYKFSGKTIDGNSLVGSSILTHAVPAGPTVHTQIGPGDHLVIRWDPVTTTPPGFPNEPITIAGYQVIVDTFQLTLPATATSVTVSPEFVAALAPGEHPFEVLAIEAGGNQTITESSFTT